MDLGQLVGISVPLTTIFALVVVAALYLWLRKQDTGTEQMRKNAHFIQLGFVVGDTFGDPLKDTAGPSLHILIKLQNILAITLLSLFYAYHLPWR